MVDEDLILKKMTTDAYSRFYIIKSILDILYRGDQSVIKVIDVGGGSPYMSLSLSESSMNYSLTSLDILPKPSNFDGDYVVGDATNMKFKDNSFGSSISTDTLEHIPDNKKLKLVKECIRVASDYVVISAPFESPVVSQAEDLTNKLNKMIFKQGQEWLEDHFRKNKPDMGLIVGYIEKAGYDYVVLGSNNIYNWILSTHLNLIAAGYGLDRDKVQSLNFEQNDNIRIDGDMRPPHYRHTIVVFKNKVSESKKTAILELANGETDSGLVVKYLSDSITILTQRVGELWSKNNDYAKKIRLLNNQLEYNKKAYEALLKKHNTFSIDNINVSVFFHQAANHFHKSKSKEK